MAQTHTHAESVAHTHKTTDINIEKYMTLKNSNNK